MQDADKIFLEYVVKALVDNPNDAPDMWQYEYIFLPQEGKSLYSW